MSTASTFAPSGHTHHCKEDKIKRVRVALEEEEAHGDQCSHQRYNVAPRIGLDPSGNGGRAEEGGNYGGTQELQEENRVDLQRRPT